MLVSVVGFLICEVDDTRVVMDYICRHGRVSRGSSRGGVDMVVLFNKGLFCAFGSFLERMRSLNLS